MASTSRWYAAACQIDLPNPKSRDEIGARVRHMLEMVDRAVVRSLSRLRPFPLSAGDGRRAAAVGRVE